MLRIATLFTTGLLTTAVALAREEPPPPVEGWTLIAAGYSFENPLTPIGFIDVNGVPGYYNFNIAVNTHRIVIEENYPNGHPSPSTSPVWHSDLSTVVNQAGQTHIQGTVEAGYNVISIIIETRIGQEFRSQTFQYNLWSFQKMRSLDARTVSTSWSHRYNYQ